MMVSSVTIQPIHQLWSIFYNIEKAIQHTIDAHNIKGNENYCQHTLNTPLQIMVS